MKRAKLGDLYCMKVPNGYKIYQGPTRFLMRAVTFASFHICMRKFQTILVESLDLNIVISLDLQQQKHTGKIYRNC